jgi:hypothetical protein
MNCIFINFSYYYHRIVIALCLWTNTKVIRILIHSSFCVYNFMLLACRPNFAEVAHVTLKVERACLTEFYNFIVLCVVSSKSPVNVFVSTTLWSVNIFKICFTLENLFKFHVIFFCLCCCGWWNLILLNYPEYLIKWICFLVPKVIHTR